jgi:hypothetical protein
MMLRRLLLPIVATMAMPFFASATPADDLQASQEKLSGIVIILGRLVGARGDAELRSLYDSTRFDVRKLGVPNMAVGMQGGQFTVSAAAEYHLLMTYVADTSIVTMTRPKYNKCAAAYGQYLSKEIQRLRERAAESKPIGRFLAPEEFARDRLDLCDSWWTFFPIPEAQRPARDSGVNAAIILSFLHELGHIALNHRGPDFESLRSVPEGTRRMKVFMDMSKHSRDQEDAADQWGTDRAVMLGATPRDIINPTLISGFIVFTGVDCSLERIDDHSNGATRVQLIISRYIQQVEKQGARIDAQIKALSNEYVALAKKARAKLSCDK